MEHRTFEEIEKADIETNPTLYKRIRNFQCKKGFHSLTKKRIKDAYYKRKQCRNCTKQWTKYI